MSRRIYITEGQKGRPAGIGFLGSHSRWLLGRSLVTFLGILVIGLPLSRFYVVIPSDRFQCFEPKHTHQADLRVHSQHGHGQEESLSAPAPQGSYFQHCKDTYDGIGLTPVQPFGVPVQVSTPQPQTTEIVSLQNNDPAIDADLPPPFQPPRQQS